MSGHRSTYVAVNVHKALGGKGVYVLEGYVGESGVTSPFKINRIFTQFGTEIA